MRHGKIVLATGSGYQERTRYITRSTNTGPTLRQKRYNKREAVAARAAMAGSDERIAAIIAAQYQ